MNQLQELFRRLSWKQRATIACVALAVAAGLYQFSVWNRERDFKPLFSGMAAEDAGAVTAKLKELGIEYRLRDEGAAVLIPESRIAETRLELASAGLPRSGRIGFELFDKANFGASEFTEQVNYQRAVEGELERSIMSIRAVEMARVHVTPAKDSLYLESRQPAKASILVKLRRGAELTAQNAAAITQLAASAVPGLAPDQVSVLDTGGNLLSRPKARNPADGGEPSEGALEYRKSVERDLQSKIAATLEPLLGTGRFRAGVSAEVDFSSGEQSEEIFDPQKSVMAASQRTDDGPALPASSGVPGTAANVPNPTATRASGASTTNYSRHTENVTYQTSRLVKHTRLPQGTVRRLSLSVLIDHALRWEGTKRIVEPPSPEKLKVIRDLITAATGLDTNRGDQLVVEAFPFEATLNAEPVNPAAPPAPLPPPGGKAPAWLEKLMAQKNFALIAGIGGAAVMALLGGFIYFWRRSRKKKISALTAAAIEGGKPENPVTAADVEKRIEAKLAEQAAEYSRKEAEALAALQVGNVSTKKTEVLTKHIAAEIKKNPSGMAQVVRSWLSGEYRR